MIRTLTFFAYALASLSTWALAQTSISTSTQLDGIHVDVSISGYKLSRQSTPNGVFQKLQIPGEGLSHEVGAPQLPVIRFEIEVPSSQSTLVLKYNSLTWAQLKTNSSLPIAPAQESTAKLPGVKSRFAFNQQIYKLDEVAAPQIARIVQIGSIRGRQIASVEISPVKYSPKTGELQTLNHVQFVIETAGPLMSSEILPSSAIDSALSQSVLNISAQKGNPRDRLLVLVAPSLEKDSSFQKLMALKSSRGLEVTVAKKDQFGNTPEQIRAYIQKAYQSSNQSVALTYVLIVGDPTEIPAYRTSQFTDNYYAAIDKQDYAGDQVYRDLAIGRLPAKTPAELKVMVDKIVKYDTETFKDRSWLKRAAWLGTDDRYDVAEGTHNYVIDTYTKQLNYTGIFPTSQEAGGDKLYAVTNHAGTEDVLKSMNDGRSFIVYSGHGSETYWVGPSITATEVSHLSHPDASPYVMAFACLTNSFANSEDSFSKTWMKNSNGSVGYFGASNLSYWDEDDILERVFFDGFYKNHITSAGILNNFGLDGVRKQYSGQGRSVYYYEIYNLMGDPTLALK